MKHATHAACWLLLALCTGCSLQPAYVRPELPVASSYPGRPAEAPMSLTALSALTTPVAPASQADLATEALTDWREVLIAPRLQQLVALALANNRDLRVAALNMDKVRAQYQIQRAALGPRLDAGASLAGSHKPASMSSSGKVTETHELSANLGVSWELDVWGRVHSLSDAAWQQYVASSHARQAVRLLLIAQVADQYLTLQSCEEQRQITQDTLSAARQTFRLMKLQFDTGTLTELDLRLSQTRLEQAQINLAAQTRAKAQAENALTLLIGQALPPPPPPSLAPPRSARPAPAPQPPRADVPVGVPSDLLQRRPDILQAEAALRAENANIGAARAAFFPSLSLTGTAGAMSTTLGGLFAAGSGAWTFAPVLSLPIFSGGATQARLDVAVVQRDVAVAQYEKAIQTAFKEVADGLAARDTDALQLAAQRRYVEAQQRRLVLAQRLYENGLSSYLEVLAAHTELYSARQALVTVRLDAGIHQIDLYRALGGGWQPQGQPG